METVLGPKTAMVADPEWIPPAEQILNRYPLMTF